MFTHRFLLSCALFLGLAGSGPHASAETEILIRNHRLSGPAAALEPEVLDFRYAPERSQTCVGLPDDTYKTLVGSDGGLYSDYGRGSAKLFGFGTRLLAGLIADGEPASPVQELRSPKVPIVTTRCRRGSVELRQVVWAGAPGEPGSGARRDFLWLTAVNHGAEPAEARLTLSAVSVAPLALAPARTSLVDKESPASVLCSFSRPCDPLPADKPQTAERLRIVSAAHRTVRNWAAPAVPCSDAFQHVVVGNRAPLEFVFTAEPGKRYVAVFGLIEAWHKEQGKRPMELAMEGKTARQLDLIRDPGRNQPLVLSFPAQDADGDGKIRLAVKPVPGAEDQSPVLGGLWVFPDGAAPAESSVLAGKGLNAALGYADATHLPGLITPLELGWDCGALAPGQSFELLVTLPQGEEARRMPVAPGASTSAEVRRAVRYWETLPLPYDVIRVPDPAVQGLLDGCVRNLYQAREIKNGRPKFQVGPTCYRGAWAADGAFILETIAYLGRPLEARQGIEAQIDQDDGPGGVEFSKKAGLRLFTLWRHAQLTGDRGWLGAMWPRVEREVRQIQEYRAMSRADPSAPNFGLMPPGLGDGGLSGPFREYTNVYWTLAGLRAAIDAAHWLGKRADAAAWEAELADYWAVFDKARRRDKRVDAAGNSYVPPVMQGEPEQLPQRGAWAFLQSVYPGRVFTPEDELMRGTLAMLDANQREGLIYGTGWIADGIWNYAGSFYAHAHLWLGHGRKASATLYAFGNHASPLLCWREEQNVRGEKEKYVGDMPHNWASAEFIRLVRHLLVLERDRELHLLEGFPSRWNRPSAWTRLADIPTSFGPMSLDLRVAPDGRSATLTLDPPRRNPPDSVVVHAEHLGCADAPPTRMPAAGPVTIPLTLRH